MWIFSATPDRSIPKYEDAFDALLNAHGHEWALLGNNRMVVIAPTLARFALRVAEMVENCENQSDAKWAGNWALNENALLAAKGAARHACLAIGREGEWMVRELFNRMCLEVLGPSRGC